MKMKVVGAGLILAGTLVMSGNTSGVHASPRLRPAALVTTDGILDVLADVRAGSNSSAPSFGPVLNGRMLFTANDGSTGRELWATDGTTNGTALLKNIDPGSTNGTPNSSDPSSMTRAGNKVFFRAYTVANGSELWVSDGTSDGTVLVKDFDPSMSGQYPNSGSPYGFTALGSRVVFAANSPSEGTELWISDGTPSGTTLLKDIRAGTDGSYPQYFTELGGKLYFQAQTSGEGGELWVTDGTPSGTTLLKDIDPTSSNGFPNSGSPTGFQVFQNKLYFTAYDATGGNELWVTDGTPSGTTLFADIVPGSGSSYPSRLTVVNDKMVFSANNGTTGYELWVSNGTANGTVQLYDIYAGSNSGSPQNLTVIGNRVYFWANDGATGSEPWRSDGTLAGTVRVADINSGANGSRPYCMMCGFSRYFIEYGDKVIFVADNPTYGTEPYITDGTTLGTRLIADVRAGSNGSSGAMFYGDITPFVSLDGRMILSLDNGLIGSELWTFSSPPGAPTSVTAVASTNSATISWLAPTVTGSPITSYTVTSNPGAFTCTTATLTCPVTGLLSNQDYTFTVTATSALGTGAASLPSPRVRTLSPQLGSLLNSLTTVTDIVSDNTLTAGDSVTTLYTGFNANELVLMLMASNPVVIGSANADASGNVAITGTIPSNASAGNHTLALYAPVSGFGAKQAITVTVSPGSGAASGNGTSSGGGGGSPSVDPTTLPATGRGANPSLPAYLLLIAGIGLLGGRRTVAPLLRNHPRRSR